MNGKRLFCFGCGFSARSLATRLAHDGWRVTGTTRKRDKFAELEALGIEPVIFTGDAPMDRPARQRLADSSHILLSIPPGESADPVLRFHGMDIASQPDTDWLGYLSTTGVYGDRGGDWVDETTDPTPATERGGRRLEAENAWLTMQRHGKLPVHIFRLAGIYGPGRNALETVKSGKARSIVKPGQVFSRIHVDDIADVLAASIARPNPGAVYNVCDDRPCPPEEVLDHAAALLNLPSPPKVPFEQADLSPMAKSFYADNKRVRNDRIKQELGVELTYPTYREGLKALLETTARPSRQPAT